MPIVPKTSRRKGVSKRDVRVCAYCKKQFNTYPSLKSKYCNMECYYADREPPVVLTCQFCEEPFTEYLSDIDTGRRSGLYCSSDCRHNARRVICSCAHCGAEFVESRSRVNESKGIYCSKVCYSVATSLDTSRGVWKKCKTCQKDFRVSPYVVKKGWGDFCSRKCSHVGENNPQWIDGHTVEYPPVWTREFRMAIRKRDGFKCRLCHKHGFDVHHIDYDKQNCSPENLATLCHSCHAKTNHGREKWLQVFADLG